MKKLFVIIFLISLFSSSDLLAQDTIRTNRDTIFGKVLEIGIDVIRYTDITNLTGPVISILKSDVKEIKYENGSRFIVTPDPYDVNKVVQVRQKTRSLKFEFFSPLTNDIAFGYESMLSVGKNIEIKLGIIGPGTQANSSNASGIFVKGGVKYLLSPMYVVQGMKYAHSLNGGYIKPEIIFNTYTKDKVVYSNYYNGLYYSQLSTISSVRFTNICFNLVYGKQFILGNIMTFDYYVGLGYGYRNTNYKSLLNNNSDVNDEYYSYSHLYFGTNSPLIISGGITLGVLF